MPCLLFFNLALMNNQGYPKDLTKPIMKFEKVQPPDKIYAPLPGTVITKEHCSMALILNSALHATFFSRIVGTQHAKFLFSNQ